MTEASEKKQGMHGALDDELVNLRTLLVSPEQQEIAVLKERLNDPDIRAEELSRVLAEAIVIRASKDKKLAQALLPTIELTIKDSVKKDPKFLADAIFPVIGPAIRKAISESIRSMVQSINETMSYAFSWQGLKWRIESIQTGRPFAEIVLLHTLIYSVEQVFLVHRETGLLLQHVAATEEGIKDVDMVSGMLTAIQDFVHDSFGVSENQVLQSLNVGDYTIWVEQGPQVALAAVIRGNPPESLRAHMEEELEKIEFEQRYCLQDFKGDVAPFALSRHHLESCLMQAKRGIGEAGKTTIPASTAKPARKRSAHDLIWLIIGAGIISLLLILGSVIFQVAGK